MAMVYRGLALSLFKSRLSPPRWEGRPPTALVVRSYTNAAASESKTATRAPDPLIVSAIEKVKSTTGSLPLLLCPLPHCLTDADYEHIIMDVLANNCLLYTSDAADE